QGAADERGRAEGPAAGGAPEFEALALHVRVADLAGRAVARKESRAARTRCIDGGLDHDAQLLIDVVRRSERLAEADDYVPQPAALRIELPDSRLELVRHVVERSPKQRELVAAANGDALREPAACDPVSRPGTASKRPHDGAAFEIRQQR